MSREEIVERLILIERLIDSLSKEQHHLNQLLKQDIIEMEGSE
jgi:hypothetical protein